MGYIKDNCAFAPLMSDLQQQLKGFDCKKAQQVASRYLLVDAVNHPAVLRYYERNGFFPVYRNEEEERAAMEVAEDEALRTRFMICDLITFRNSLS